MGGVLVHRSMSLDGFIAGPDHDMDWIFEHPGDERWREIMEGTGAIIAGRNSQRVNERVREGAAKAPYGGAWSGALFVLTHGPYDPPDGITVLSGDIREAVATAQAAAGGKRVELFGADITAQAFAARLVDVVIVHLLPVVLGEGIPFSPGSGRIDLELVERRASGPTTTLQFRVRR
jgi:dihydrofolate reductase